MIRSLRRKFIVVTMAIVTVLLCVIFGLVIWFTASNLRMESIRFLEQAAEGPMDPVTRQRPCLVVRVTPWGRSVQSVGGFELRDEQMLSQIVTLAASSGAELMVNLTNYETLSSCNTTISTVRFRCYNHIA